MFSRLWLLLLFATLPLLASASPAKQYKALQKEAAKLYAQASRLRWKDPCEAFLQIQTYRTWLDQKDASTEASELKPRVKRMWRNYLRSRKRLSDRFQKQTQASCLRYWKGEIQRRPSALKPACSARFGAEGRAAGNLVLGIRPWAHLYLNGQMCGTAPLEASLRPGTYQIRLIFPPGSDSYETPVVIQARAATLLPRQMNQAPPPQRSFQGLLSPEQIAWTLKTNQKTLRSCTIYQSDIQEVILSWDIDTQGVPQEVQWHQPATAMPRFQSCITRAVALWRFPKPQGVVRIRSQSIQLPTSASP